MNDHFLEKKLHERSALHALRSLRLGGKMEDYFSNDYLGIVKNGLLEKKLTGTSYPNGSTGSRLLAGNYPLMEETEKQLSLFHDAPSALIFNSGYDANLGLLSCISQRGDLILYDKLSHASIRDGIRLSLAESFSFAHNDLHELETKLIHHREPAGRNCFVVTESVFSMDGDMAPLPEIVNLCEKYDARLIVDEAHATGVIGNRGEGLMQFLGLHQHCFARIHTFGKALGCHGAVIMGSEILRDYLINFCRPFIYSTALPPASVAAIQAAYQIFPGQLAEREILKKLIALFDHPRFKKSTSPIQCMIIPGNDQVKESAKNLTDHQLDVRPILYPTVPKGEERLRIALHSFNTLEETQKLISILTNP